MAPTLAILISVGATAIANARRLRDGRVWLAFVAGAIAALVISAVSRPFVQLAGQLGGWESDSSVLYLISSSVHGTIAELFKITAALLLLSSSRTAFGQGDGLGAAIGAGAAVSSIAQFLQGALAIASLGLPGGQSLAQGILTSLSLVLLSAATTGLGAGFAARGRLAGGIALALGLTFAVDPGLRLFSDGTPGFVARLVLAALLFGWLLARTLGAPSRSAGDLPALVPAVAGMELEGTGGDREPGRPQA